MGTFASAAPIVAPNQSSVNHESASTQESLFLWMGRQITLLVRWITKQAFDAFHFLTTFTTASSGPINTRTVPWNPVTLAPTINSSHIFSYLDHVTLRSCTRVSKTWQTQTTAAAVLQENVQYQELMRNKRVAFGPNDWRTYFGDPGVVPPLDPKTYKILKSPCPFWLGKRVEQTHLLLCLPRAINGASLTLNRLGALAGSPQGGGIATGYNNITLGLAGTRYAETSMGPACWLLITKGIIPKSRGISFNHQVTLLNGRPGYRVAQVGEAIALAFTKRVSSGEYLLRDTYTRCEEEWPYPGFRGGLNLIVGGFSGNGIDIHHLRDCRSYWDENESKGNCTGVIVVLPCGSFPSWSFGSWIRSLFPW